MGMEIIEEKPISMAMLREELKEIKKRDTELSFRAQKTEEYLENFHILKEKEAEELFNKINKIGVPRLKEMHIHKIIDILPKNMNELKAVILQFSITITNENLNKILEAVSDYVPKKK